ncbi:hypothetical protein ACFVFS_15610 [Kitasatospora sp. NPDC057692]|uniref:hypothetical protein n=1 Tax=Kitasatospora sp. NPDC057692 TaxID=3346215 RepID=UPI0036A84AB0
MDRIRTAGTAVAAGAVAAAIGSGAGWPAWLWASASAAGALAALLTSVARARGEGPPAAPPAQAVAPVFHTPAPAPEPPVEQPYQSLSVTGVALPSAVPDYDFLFSATVWWRQVPGTGGVSHAAPGSLAVETVLARARAVTEREQPGRSELVRHQLGGVLGIPVPDASGIVVAMAGQVVLGLSEADRERLDKLAEVRKTEEIWEQERRHERSMRAYLGEEVLKSPGSAVVWWLARNDDEVRGAVDMIGPLAQLAAAANDRAVDVLYQHLVAPEARRGHAAPFLNGLAPLVVAGGGPAGAAGAAGAGAPGPSVVGPLNDLMRDLRLDEADERAVYAHRVARFTEVAGRPEAAARIRESLGDDVSGESVGGASVGAAPEGSSEGVPGQRVFVVGPVRPDGGAEAQAGPVGSAWEALRGPVDGEARGTGNGTGEGWGGADQSYE